MNCYYLDYVKFSIHLGLSQIDGAEIAIANLLQFAVSMVGFFLVLFVLAARVVSCLLHNDNNNKVSRQSQCCRPLDIFLILKLK